MDEKDFKKHLRDLAHGEHHPQEHDWSDSNVQKTDEPVKTESGKATKRVVRKARRKAS